MTMPRLLCASALAGLLATGSAQAATMMFTDFTSTNSVQLNPTVTIDDGVSANAFRVTVTLGSGDIGTLGGVFLDISNPSGLATTSYGAVVPNGTDLGSNFTYVADDAGFDAKDIDTGQCTSNSNLNGTSGLPMFEAAVCYKSTGNPNSRPNHGLLEVAFDILDPNGILSLSQFSGVGLRYQQSNNGSSTNEASDKLFSSTGTTSQPPLSTMPLPAAGWMLLAGLAGMVAMGRRKQSS